MSTVDNASIVRRWFAEYNRGNLAVAGELVAADIINHDAPPDLPPGREGYLRYIADVRAGLPDLRVTIEDLLADGDRVAVRLTLRGTHRGDLSGLAPTGKPVTLPQLNFCALRTVGSSSAGRSTTRSPCCSNSASSRPGSRWRAEPMAGGRAAHASSRPPPESPWPHTRSSQSAGTRNPCRPPTGCAPVCRAG